MFGKTNKLMEDRALENDKATDEPSVISNKTSASRRSVGSLAHEKHFTDRRAQFNDMLDCVKDQHSQEFEKT
jgi:hypothetical protein